MSRGPGNLQREILSYLQAEGGATTLETARWAIHAKPEADLPKAWSFSFARAVSVLASVSQGKRIVIEKRPLETVREWTDHYPGKTHRADVRKMRIELLPALADWVTGDGGPGPLFSAGEIEQHHAKGQTRGRLLSTRVQDVVPFAHEWKALEQELRPYLSQPNSDELFYLVARGKMLFVREPVEARASFGELLRLCEAKQLVPADLILRLRSLLDRFFPPHEASRLDFKSSLYPCATSVIHGHCEIKPGALAALYRVRSAYLETIPGFRAPKPRPKGLFVFEDDGWDGGFTKNSLLSRLIDQTVYQKFHFLRLN